MDNIDKKHKTSIYTMMERLDNIHLVKDVGMFPYVLYKKYNYDSYLVSYGKGEEEYQYLKKNIKGVKLVVRPRYTGKSLIDGIFWLILNAKKIHILNLYHYKPSTFIWAIFYKVINRNGLVWVKLDIVAEDGKKMKMKPHSLKYLLTKKVLGSRVVVSAETKSFCEYAIEKWPIKIYWIPNGVLVNEIEKTEDKEKIILTVGRLGAKQKATEILLEAFVKALPHIDDKWKLILVGSMTEEFSYMFDELLASNEFLENRIIKMGEITDREVLCDIYRKTSIFTMPSRWEGFGLVALEAMAKRCYLLTSNLESYIELRNNDEFGAGFNIDDVNEYSTQIIKTCTNFDEGKIRMDNLSKYMMENYSYEAICSRLHNIFSKN